MKIKIAIAISAAAVLLSGCSFMKASIGGRPQTGLTKDGDLLVVYDSPGFSSEYMIMGEKAIVEDVAYYSEKHKGYECRLFRPYEQGECSLIFRTIDQGTNDIWETQVFDVTVSEQLEMTYTSRMTQLLPVSDLLGSSESVTVTRDGFFSIYGAENSALIVDETTRLFGSWSSCTADEADTTDMSCISVDYTGSQGVQYSYEFWFGQGDTAYSCRRNENGLEEWQVYTLDPVSSFETLNMILDSLEGMYY